MVHIVTDGSLRGPRGESISRDATRTGKRLRARTLFFWVSKSSIGGLKRLSGVETLAILPLSPAPISIPFFDRESRMRRRNTS